MSDASAFSPDYGAARARFRAAAHALGARLEAHPIDQAGPDGEPLTLDVAILGSAEPSRAVVISSGLHGVEGFFGSAVQAALMEDVLGGWSPPPDGALILLHALNPYGFAWLRRVNENNVDLNRNFLRDGEAYTGSPAGYAELDPFLNTPTAPGRLDRVLFLPRAGLKLARHGMAALKNSVAGGQYDFPRGVFYGGPELQRSGRILDAELPRWVGQARRVVHIDFHTGLGARGDYKLFVDHAWGSPGAARLGAAFGEGVVEPWEPERGTSYAIRGGLGTWCKARLPHVDYDVLACEFGTVHVLRVIQALQEENRATWWGGTGHPSLAPARERLRDTFAPPERTWRDEVVPRGLQVARQAIDHVLG